MLPESYFGLFRFFISSFTDLFEVLTGEELIAASSTFFGLYQSTDATDGEFSLQMQADTTFSFTDVFTAFECPGELPSSFCFDLKHVGGGADTLSIIGTFDEESNLSFDEYGLTEASGFFTVDTLVVNGDTDWVSYNIPIIDNMNGVSPDTALLFFVLSSNEDSLALGVESYFLIDNLNFKLEGVLPLAMSAFDAVHENNYNKITWSVLNEQNISHYIIERSFDNIENWIEIENVGINPQGLTDYSYKDLDITKRGNYYYRIKQIDLNGEVSLSQVVHVEVPILNHLSMLSFPNPASDQITFEFFLSEANDNISYNLFNAEGKQFTFSSAFPTYLPEGYHRISLNIMDLPSGVYSMTVDCLLYTSPSPRDQRGSRMPSAA